MFVQRLINWLRRVFSAFTARPRASQPPQTDASAVMSGCAAGQRGASSGSWLDDGRGLRPRPAAKSTQEPRWTVRGIAPRQQPAEPPSQNRRPVPSRPVPAHPAAEAASAGDSVARPQPPQPAPSLPAVPPARLTPASFASHDAHGGSDGSDGDDSGVHDQALYRRLMSLKRLVRLGIYGEGFDAHNVPEQYLHSLGRDDDFDNFDDFDADWDEHQPAE